MKLKNKSRFPLVRPVAPHAGAWIETDCPARCRAAPACVAPHAGAWIETIARYSTTIVDTVAPHAGAWIETSGVNARASLTCRRPPRGGVD